MCGPSRNSEGGIIAILKPKPTTRPGLKRELSLRLVESSETGGITASVNGVEPENWNAQHDLIVHHDGDLRPPAAMDETSILHRIRIPDGVLAGASFLIKSKLDLGVGGDGIIGRRVSLVMDELVVGQGIIGYN